MPRRHSAGAGVDQDPLAHLQVELPEKRIVGGEKGLGNRAGFLPGETVWHPHRLPLVHADVLRVAPTPHNPHHPTANSPEPRADPHRIHLAGVLEPRHLLRRTRRRGIAPATLQQIGPVQRRGANPYPDLPRTRYRHRSILYLKHLRRPRPRDHHRSHRPPIFGVRGDRNTAKGTRRRREAVDRIHDLPVSPRPLRGDLLPRETG